MALLGAIGYGGMSAAWTKLRYTANFAAARGASPVSQAPAAAAAKQNNALSVGMAAAAGAAASAALPARELPYVPEGFGPVELATRTRAQFPGLGFPDLDAEAEKFHFSDTEAADEAPGLSGTEGAEEGLRLPGAKEKDGTILFPGADEAEEKFRLLGTEKEEDEFRFPWEDEDDDGEDVQGVEDADSPAEVMNDTKCQTCAKRKYQDGSDDPGVSFKTAQHIDPDVAPSRVRGHEMEHVVRERAEAQREGRKVVSQSVVYHTGICPECGRFYVSGGTTRTVTANDNTKDLAREMAEKVKRNMGLDITA